MFSRIKSILVWGGLYLWVNFVLFGLGLLIAFCGFPDFIEIIFDNVRINYIFFAAALFIFLIKVDFRKYISENQALFFMYTGWLPYLYYITTMTGWYDTDIWLLLFLLSSSAAIFKFSEWQKSEKALLLLLIWGVYFLALLGDRALPD